MNKTNKTRDEFLNEEDLVITQSIHLRPKPKISNKSNNNQLEKDLYPSKDNSNKNSAHLRNKLNKAETQNNNINNINCISKNNEMDDLIHKLTKFRKYTLNEIDSPK